MTSSSKTHGDMFEATTRSVGCAAALRSTVTTFYRNIKHEPATLKNSEDADDDADDGAVYAQGETSVISTSDWFLDLFLPDIGSPAQNPQGIQTPKRRKKLPFHLRYM
ncbi:hypothetical protein T484DRAFT_1881763 [Baffinella frigidus]|nr:hypothetical protein T484DRAFT_1881763 [Cryptophyta sp. CCMP2293]